jgi:photosystem II stability/assembly factor-like uncharacterized protein
MSHPFKVGSRARIVRENDRGFPLGALVTAVEVEHEEYDGNLSAVWETEDGEQAWLVDDSVQLVTSSSDFDLLGALTGKALKFRSGCAVKFVAYVPDAKPHCQLVLLSANGNVFYRYANGKTSEEPINDPGDVLVA